MKQAQRLWEIVRVALFIAAAISISNQALASPGSTARETEEHSADIRAALTVRLVTLPDAPSFTARGQGQLRYRIRESAAILKAESIPELVYESTEPVGEYGRITIVVAAIPGTEPILDWSDYPRVTLTPLDLRVRAYAAAATDITASTAPLTDVVLEDLSFSTDRIEVEGESAQGYIDVEGPEAQVVGRAILPHDPLPQYADQLSGEPAILEFVVTIPNPYKK